MEQFFHFVANQLNKIVVVKITKLTITHTKIDHHIRIEIQSVETSQLNKVITIVELTTAHPADKQRLTNNTIISKSELVTELVWDDKVKTSGTTAVIYQING